MKRQQLLTPNKEGGETLIIENLIKKDEKFLKRSIRDLEDEIEDCSTSFLERLAVQEPIDKSTIEVHYKKMQDLRAKKALYEEFKADFYE